jgi:hypothetical protein
LSNDLLAPKALKVNFESAEETELEEYHYYQSGELDDLFGQSDISPEKMKEDYGEYGDNLGALPA